MDYLLGMMKVCEAETEALLLVPVKWLPDQPYHHLRPGVQIFVVASTSQCCTSVNSSAILSYPQVRRAVRPLHPDIESLAAHNSKHVTPSLTPSKVVAANAMQPTIVDHDAM